MGAKMGRPTDNPKTERIMIRATKDDKELLNECCNISKTSQYEVIMEGIRMVHAKIKK